jgi:flagellar basal body-associated protein FliL
MHYAIMSDLLALLGQAAAIILLLYLMVLILIGLVLRLALMLGASWVREKAELIKLLRPTVDSVNTTTEAALHGTLPADQGNKVIRAVAEIPVYAHTIDQKVEQGSEKVADAVIEFRARTEMAKAVLKTFLRPGLKPPQKALPGGERVGLRSPGLVDEKLAGEGLADSASQLQGASVKVVASPPKEETPITASVQGVPPTKNVPTNS